MSAIAAVNLTVQPTKRTTTIPLERWLDGSSYSPLWLPLAKIRGVNRVMAVCSCAEYYQDLVKSIQAQLHQTQIVQWQNRSYEIAGIEADLSPLQIFSLDLDFAAPLPHVLPTFAHALIFKWLNRADPQLAEKLHETQAKPPFTVSISQANSSRRQMVLKITTLQTEILPSLLWGLHKDLGKTLYIAGILCQVAKTVKIHPSTTYQKLAEIPATQIIALEFVSPTAFTILGRKPQKEYQLLPVPELVFENLRNRWNQSAPTPLHFPPPKWRTVVQKFKLQSEYLKHNKQVEVGFSGSIEYRFLDSDCAQIATTLAHFAFYSGVGRKTGMGMGQVTLTSQKIADSLYHF